MKKKLILSVFLIILATQNIFPQTVHLLIMGATNDNTIGASVQVSVDDIKERMKLASSQAGVTLKVYEGTGSNYTKSYFEKLFSQVTSNMNPATDVFMVWLDSHGYRFEDTDTWPYLSMHPTNGEEISKKTMKEQSLWLKSVYDRVKATKAKLGICIAECCNTSIGIETPKDMMPQAMTVGGYTALLKNSSGYYIISSSSKNQPSYGNPNSGGFFTSGFLHALNYEIAKGTGATWDGVFATTVNQTVEIWEAVNKKSSKPLEKQVPQYQATPNRTRLKD